MVLFGIKDDFANTKAIYKDLFMFTTSNEIYHIPQKYIDSKKSYRNTYFFTNRQQAELFLAELELKYKGR